MTYFQQGYGRASTTYSHTYGGANTSYVKHPMGIYNPIIIPMSHIMHHTLFLKKVPAHPSNLGMSEGNLGGMRGQAGSCPIGSLVSIVQLGR